MVAYAASNVDMALILGPTNPPTLAVLAFRLAADPDPARRTEAAAAALLQAAIVLGSILLFASGERVARRLAFLVAGAGPRRSIARAATRLAGVVPPIAAGLPVVAILGGLLVLALWSIAGPWPYPDPLPSAYTARAWLVAWGALTGPVLVTVGLASASAVTAVALVLLCLENWEGRGLVPSRRLLAIIYAPLLVPQIAFAFGLSVLLIGTRLDGSVAGLLLVHLVFVLPYAYLSLSGPWRAFDIRLSLVAAGLGASRTRIFLAVRLPILLRPILVALALAFSVSVALYLPTQLVTGGRIATVTTEALALASGLDRRLIGVVSILQAGLPAIAFALAMVVPAFLHRRRRGLQAGGAA